MLFDFENEQSDSFEVTLACAARLTLVQPFLCTWHKHIIIGVTYTIYRLKKAIGKKAQINLLVWISCQASTQYFATVIFYAVTKVSIFQDFVPSVDICW